MSFLFFYSYLRNSDIILWRRLYCSILDSRELPKLKTNVPTTLLCKLQFCIYCIFLQTYITHNFKICYSWFNNGNWKHYCICCYWCWVGELQHLCACALFEYDCKTCFFSLPVSDKNTAEVSKTFIEYLMIFNVKPVSHIHDRLHSQILDPKH